MPSRDWMANTLDILSASQTAEDRSHSTLRRINRKPSTIIIERSEGVFLAAQTVRIEGVRSDNVLGTIAENNAQVYVRDIVVFGLRDHPTLPDLDIRVGDRFGWDGDDYRITGINPHSGEVQAFGLRIQR